MNASVADLAASKRNLDVKAKVCVIASAGDLAASKRTMDIKKIRKSIYIYASAPAFATFKVAHAHQKHYINASVADLAASKRTLDIKNICKSM